LALTVSQTPISDFLGFNIFGFDIFCETLQEAVRLVGKPIRLVVAGQTGCGATGTFVFVLLPPPRVLKN
jgi:hypothetical protein